MNIIYTKHIEKKLRAFQEADIKITKRLIEKVIKKPLHIDNETDTPKIIASGKLDSQHVLRVVYKQNGDIIKIITCYPAKRGRYFAYENEN